MNLALSSLNLARNLGDDFLLVALAFLGGSLFILTLVPATRAWIIKVVKAFEAWIFKENTKEENGILYAIRGGFMLFYVLTMMLIMAGVAFILMWSLVNLVVLLVGALTPGPA